MSSSTTTTTATRTIKVQFDEESNQVHYIDTSMEPSQVMECFYQPEDYLQFRAEYSAFKRETARQAKLLRQFNMMTTKARHELLQQGKMDMTSIPLPAASAVASSSSKSLLPSQMQKSMAARGCARMA